MYLFSINTRVRERYTIIFAPFVVIIIDLRQYLCRYIKFLYSISSVIFTVTPIHYILFSSFLNFSAPCFHFLDRSKLPQNNPLPFIFKKIYQFSRKNSSLQYNFDKFKAYLLYITYFFLLNCKNLLQMQNNNTLLILSTFVFNPLYVLLLQNACM